MENDKEDNASEAPKAADLPSWSWLWVVVEIWKFSPYFTFQGKLLKISMPDKGENVLEMSKTMLQRVPIESMHQFYVWAWDNIVSPINFLIYSPVCVTNGHSTWPCCLWMTSTLLQHKTYKAGEHLSRFWCFCMSKRLYLGVLVHM